MTATPVKAVMSTDSLNHSVTVVGGRSAGLTTPAAGSDRNSNACAAAGEGRDATSAAVSRRSTRSGRQPTPAAAPFTRSATFAEAQSLLHLIIRDDADAAGVQLPLLHVLAGWEKPDAFVGQVRLELRVGPLIWHARKEGLIETIPVIGDVRLFPRDRRDQFGQRCRAALDRYVDSAQTGVGHGRGDVGGGTAEVLTVHNHRLVEGEFTARVGVQEAHRLIRIAEREQVGCPAAAVRVILENAGSQAAGGRVGYRHAGELERIVQVGLRLGVATVIDADRAHREAAGQVEPFATLDGCALVVRNVLLNQLQARPLAAGDVRAGGLGPHPRVPGVIEVAVSSKDVVDAVADGVDDA